MTCVAKGIADFTGTTRFYAAELGYGKDSLFPKADAELPTYGFPVTTLDEAVSERLDFFKIDVEGAELLVLKGAKRMLDNPALMGVIEFHPRAAQRAGTYEIFLPTLRSYGFRLYEIGNGGEPIERSDQELIELAEKKDGINLFLRK